MIPYHLHIVFTCQGEGMVHFAGAATLYQSPIFDFHQVIYGGLGHTASNGGVVSTGPGHVATGGSAVATGPGPAVGGGSAHSSGSGSSTAAGGDAGSFNAPRTGDNIGSQAVPILVPLVAGALGCCGPGIYAELTGRIVVPPNSNLTTRLAAWMRYGQEHASATAICGLSSAVLALIVATRR